MGIELDLDPAHPRLLRALGDCNSPIRVRLVGIALEASALLRRLRRRATPLRRRGLVLSVDHLGVWLDCDACGLASWPVDTPDVGEAWLRHLAHCSGGAS